MPDEDLYHNGEHYPDPTAARAIRRAEPGHDPEVERASAVVRQIKALLAENGYRLVERASAVVRQIKALLAENGYRLVERVKFEDIYTGRELV